MALNVVAINSRVPMCAMHGSCSKHSYRWENWIKPMRDGVDITVLQDDVNVDFWKQAGHGLSFHDDLLVYDRCGHLFLHLCTGGMMGTCPQMGVKMSVPSDLLSADGYTALRSVVWRAARHSAHSCPCKKNTPTVVEAEHQQESRLFSLRSVSMFALFLLGFWLVLLARSFCKRRNSMACRDVRATEDAAAAVEYGRGSPE